MARYVELRRHTDADGDVLTQDGVRAATEIGARLGGGYACSSPRVRSGRPRRSPVFSQRSASGSRAESSSRQVCAPEEKIAGREAYEKAGSGELDALRSADPELVEADSAALGAALGRVLDALTDGGRALVVGHSPTNEAAVFGLTGQIVGPISKRARPTRACSHSAPAPLR